MAHHRTPRTTRPASSDNERLWFGITATLFAELEGVVAYELVADIVRGILDESRQHAQDRTVEAAMLEARQRLERIIRARPAHYSSPSALFEEPTGGSTLSR